MIIKMSLDKVIDRMEKDKPPRWHQLHDYESYAAEKSMGYKFDDLINAALGFLKKIQEQEPEFCAGWEGENNQGEKVTIFGEVSGELFGAKKLNHSPEYIAVSYSMSGKYWRNGEATHGDLIPNTPKTITETWSRIVRANGDVELIRPDGFVIVNRGEIIEQRPCQVTYTVKP